MGENLTALLHLALTNPDVKRTLIETKSHSDPLLEFCKAAANYGFEISLADLVWDGEDFCGAMLRSVNGGGVESFDSWSDFYELFFASLEV